MVCCFGAWHPVVEQRPASVGAVGVRLSNGGFRVLAFEELRLGRTRQEALSSGALDGLEWLGRRVQVAA
jgi:hypothetical protein